jgi:hypothetical protein
VRQKFDWLHSRSNVDVWCQQRDSYAASRRSRTWCIKGCRSTVRDNHQRQCRALRKKRKTESTPDDCGLQQVAGDKASFNQKAPTAADIPVANCWRFEVPREKTPRPGLKLPSLDSCRCSSA